MTCVKNYAFQQSTLSCHVAALGAASFLVWVTATRTARSKPHLVGSKVAVEQEDALPVQVQAQSSRALVAPKATHTCGHSRAHDAGDVVRQWWQGVREEQHA